CKGEKVIFNASTGSGYAYQWKKDDSNLSGATNSTYTSKGNESGNYTVQINNQNGCSATSPATALTRNPKPTATITALDNLDICSAGTVTLQANSGDGYTYKWFLNAVKISGASNQTYNATLAGSYTVKVKNSYGCAKTSAAVVVTSSCKLNGDEKSNGVLFSVYPNPNNGKFILRIDQSFIGEEVKVEIKNIIGQVVYADHFKWGNENKEITLPDKTISGIYLVELKVADKSYSSLLSVEKK
ncbi:MAG: T9SS type A sorting domain-containing protein, partial [Chitinophagales bacterium]|nr:T9SS type A sorting domain-containing protein [Chitinophagales bacterium]